MFDHVVVHYAEIGTKSGNRSMFEKALARNLEHMVAPWADVKSCLSFWPRICRNRSEPASPQYPTNGLRWCQ